MAVAFQILALSHGRHCYKALVIDSPVTRSNRSRGLFSFWALWWGTTRPYYLWIYLGFSMFGIFMWFNRLVAVKTVLNCIMRYQNIIERIIWDHWRLNCLCHTVWLILKYTMVKNPNTICSRSIYDRNTSEIIKKQL